MCVTDAAKQLQVRPKFLFDFLKGHRWTCRRVGSDEWTGYQDKIQTGYLEHKVTVVMRNDGSEKIQHRFVSLRKAFPSWRRC
ncbi:phage antirepressor KilAC domain-containing protein [Xenorhabdus japonica]|uniref:phage antirepressor KilAC domain-containing protein n=1 Tax=Xenorhabdus japonica TaxID=53341 RepID=UPI003BB656E0